MGLLQLAIDGSGRPDSQQGEQLACIRHTGIGASPREATMACREKLMKSARSTCFAFIGRVSLVCAVLAAALLLPGVADAAPLAVGATQFPVANEADPSAGATDLVGFPPLVAPFVGFGFTGTLTSRVLTNEASNPNGPNALTFTYQLSNSAASAHVLHRLTVVHFFQVPIIAADVSYQGASPGQAPTLADRSTSDVIGFSFADPIPGVPGVFGNIPPGGSSKLLVIQTSATMVQTSFASVINGTVAYVATYAPFTIPEPSAFVLAAVGLIGLLAVARRVRN
jgi:hypothetical protein